MVLGENGHHYKAQFIMAFSKVIPLVHFRNLDSVDLKCPMVRLGKVMVAISIVWLLCTFVSLWLDLSSFALQNNCALKL